MRRTARLPVREIDLQDALDRRAIAPLVSVVIPVYNQGQYLAAAIESVLAQKYEPIELIVVDDGSSDDTPAVISQYVDRISSIRQSNHGASHALNHGIQASQGSLVCWLSADDESSLASSTPRSKLSLWNPNYGCARPGLMLSTLRGTWFAGIQQLDGGTQIRSWQCSGRIRSTAPRSWSGVRCSIRLGSSIRAFALMSTPTCGCGSRPSGGSSSSTARSSGIGYTERACPRIDR